MPLENLELGREVQRLVRLRTANEAVVERSQQYWDQLTYDSYFRGRQNHGHVGNVGGRMGFSDFSLSTADRWLDAESPPPPDYNFNLFRRAVRQWTALFGVREPNTRFMPVNPRDPVHITRARQCNRISRSMDLLLEPQALQSKLAFHLGKSGPVFAYTRWVSSSDYGVREIPLYAEQQMQLAPPAFLCPSCGSSGFAEDLVSSGYCPGCGELMTPADFDEGLSMQVQSPTGEYRKVLNGSLVATLHTLASVSIPSGFFRVQDLPWIALVEERDRAALARIHGVTVDQIRTSAIGEMNDPTGPMARARLSSYDGQYRTSTSSDRATEGKYWISPDSYAYVREEAKRAELERLYPRGVKITIAGGLPVRLDHENLHEVWSSCLPEENDTMTPGPYLEDSVAFTDALNDAMEIVIESAAHSVPMTIFDPDMISEDDLRSHGRMHASFVKSKQRGMDLSRATGRIYPSEFRPEMMRLTQEIFAKNDEMQGLLPIIWGSVAGAETAFETDSARNQALAMLAIPWLQMRKLHQDIRRQGMMQIAKHSDGFVHLPVWKFPAPGNSIRIASIEELDDIAQGGWFVQSDEQMPQSPSQIRQNLMSMLRTDGLPPEVVQSLGILHPMNLPALASYLSVPEIRSPLLEAVEAIQAIQQRLLTEQPVQLGMDPGMAEMAGMGGLGGSASAQGAMSSSMQLDVSLYDPQLVADVLKPWLISDEGRSEEESNPSGWMNVRLFAEEAEAVLREQQQAQMMQQMQAQQAGQQPQQPQQQPQTV